MSNKMECPGCEAETSSVLGAVESGRALPVLRLESLLERVATLERRVADLEIENRTHARMDTRLCELERRAEEEDARARGEQW